MEKRNILKLLFLFLIITFFTSCSNTSLKQFNIKNFSKKETKKTNEYKITTEDKLTALTNYLVKKSLEIKKPIYPKKPTKPFVKKAISLTKSKFEKTVDFQKRVEFERKKREEYIKELEDDYKADVLFYNKQVQEITNRYNKRIKHLNNDIKTITLKAMNQAYNFIYGKAYFIPSDYDADNELYYGLIKTSKADLNKKVAIKMPPYIAQKYEKYKYKNVLVSFEYKNDIVFLKDMKIRYENKTYHAMLTNTDFKANQIKVAITSRKLDLKKSQLLSSSFKISKQDFDLGDIKYGKSKVAKLTSQDLEALNKQRLKTLNQNFENLNSLLDKAPKIKKNPKAYAIIFGIEDYLLESNVNYSQNSAMSFMQYASKTLGVPDDNIWAFMGNKTTSGFIKSQWQDFINLLEKDATVYFYYSGHGVPGSDGNSYILPSDTNAETATNDKTFMLKNIYKNLSDSKAKKVVAFVDSCFSGKDDKGELLFSGVAPVLKVKKTKFDKNKMTIFTAGSSNNFSNQYKEKQQRLFSYYLMKALALGKTNTQDLFEYIRKNVANKSRKLGVAYKQIPQLQGNAKGEIR